MLSADELAYCEEFVRQLSAVVPSHPFPPLLKRLLAAVQPVGKQPLTVRQLDVLHYIQGYIQYHKIAPTLEEIAERFRWGSLATVHEHLATLERKGWIRREPQAARGLTLLP